jgi:hypothetical protein
MIDVDAQDAFEVPTISTEQPVAALTHGPRASLGDGVRPGCAKRGPHDLNALAPDDLVEGVREPAVAVVEQVAGRGRALRYATTPTERTRYALRCLLEEAPRLIHAVVKTLVAAVDELTGARHGVLDLLEREERWVPGDSSSGTIASLSDTPHASTAKGRSVRAWDPDTRARIAARVRMVADGFCLGTPGAGQVARQAVERALGLVPDPVAERVRLLRDGSVLVELVAETRLFTVRATGDEAVHVVVRLDARRPG